MTNDKRGPLIVISGPSGSGKSTLIERLLEDRAWPLRLSVSVTTRTQRPGEQDGGHYHFWSKDAFMAERAAGGFLEWAEVFGIGNYYGTLVREVEPFRDQGQGVLLEIDVNGWEQVRRRCPEMTSIFIRTSTIEVLEERLRRRGTESETTMQKRLAEARRELARAPEYDHQVINDRLDEALVRLREIIAPLFAR